MIYNAPFVLCWYADYSARWMRHFHQPKHTLFIFTVFSCLNVTSVGLQVWVVWNAHIPYACMGTCPFPPCSPPTLISPHPLPAISRANLKLRYYESCTQRVGGQFRTSTPSINPRWGQPAGWTVLSRCRTICHLTRPTRDQTTSKPFSTLSHPLL